MIRGEIARISLSYVILVAGVAGLSSKPLAWRRTPKFAVGGTRESPFEKTLPETALGLAALFVGMLALFSGTVLGTEFAMLAFLGAVSLAARFLSAPYMAALSIRHVNGQATSAEPQSAKLSIAWTSQGTGAGAGAVALSSELHGGRVIVNGPLRQDQQPRG